MCGMDSVGLGAGTSEKEMREWCRNLGKRDNKSECTVTSRHLWGAALSGDSIWEEDRRQQTHSCLPVVGYNN